MKIIFILSNGGSSFGGTEQVASGLSRYFVDCGDQVDTVFIDKKFSYSCFGRIIELKTGFANSFCGKIINILKRGYHLNKILKNNSYDIIFNFYWFSPFLIFFYRNKIVSSYHSNPFRSSLIRRFFLKLSFKLVKKVIVPSKVIADMIFSKWHIRGVVSIPNPVNFEHVIRQSREKFDESIIKRPYILAVGRVVFEKNFELLIDAYDLTRAKRDVSLVIVGDGDKRSKIEESIAAKKLEGKVFLLGWQANPFVFMKNCLFVVSSSLTETFSLVLAEALVCGVPVISTDCIGPKEFIVNEFNGLVVKNNCINSLSNAIDKLYYDGSLRSYITNNAPNCIKKFDAKNVGNEYRKKFKELLGASE